MQVDLHRCCPPSGRCPGRTRDQGTVAAVDQKGGGSLNWPRSAPRSATRLRVVFSGVAIAHFRLGATSLASISVTVRLSPSLVSQERVLSRPTTTARLPLRRDSATFSAWSRQTLTRKKWVSPSRQVSPSRTRVLTARLKFATAVPLLVNRSSGSSVRLPIWTVKLSLLTAGLQTGAVTDGGLGWVAGRKRHGGGP